MCVGSACSALLMSLSGCSVSKHPSSQRLNETGKFRGIRGYELFISGFGLTQRNGVNAVLFDLEGRGVETGLFWEKRNSKSSGLIAQADKPLGFNVVAFDPDTVYRSNQIKDWYKSLGGTVIGEWSVNVSERIPDDLLDDLRRNPRGLLRIKLRLHREGLLVGWDIERRPVVNEGGKEALQYGPPEHSFVGGDFREAEIENGLVIRKGWFIHPRTGERLDTNF